MPKQVDMADDTVRQYVRAVGTREDAIQRALRDETAGMAGSGMQIGPEQGQTLAFLARLVGARRILEIGTYTGYSALWMAGALPAHGQLVTCDIKEDWTRVATRFWERAGVSGRIDLRLAPALETLDALVAEGATGSFDMAFIDADKTSYDAYYEHCLRLVRPGGLIAIDNVIWGGKVARPSETDPDTAALRALNAKIHGDERVDMTLTAIGDGLSLVRPR